MKKNNKWRWIFPILLIWLVLLWILVWFEAPHLQETNIETLGDALWFSLVTMTTVGYGDYYPVSTGGKVIGFLFILMSVGVFSLVISLFLSVVRDYTLPRMRLASQKQKKWYYFKQMNAGTIALAEDLATKPGFNDVLIFEASEESSVFKQRARAIHAFCFETSEKELAKMKTGHPEELHVFFMGTEGYENYQQALYTWEEIPKIKIYCETEFRPENMDDRLTCFDKYDSCARLFWQHYEPVRGEMNEIVLIGFGKYGHKLLSRAFLTNIYEPGTSFTYHVFGDSRAYRSMHTSMKDVIWFKGDNFENDGEAMLDDSKDVIWFHDRAWYENKALLQRAKHILLCEDRDSLNLETFQMIKDGFAVSGQIWLRTIDGSSVGPKPKEIKKEVTMIQPRIFGDYDAIYTEEQIIRVKLLRIARRLHQAYYDSKIKYGADPESVHTWQSLPDILKQSNIAAADHLAVKVRILCPGITFDELSTALCKKAYERYASRVHEEKDMFRRLEHTRWMRFFAIQNFTYGEKNLLMKTHDNYKSYDELTEEVKSYDDNEWKVLENYYPEMDVTS